MEESAKRAGNSHIESSGRFSTDEENFPLVAGAVQRRGQPTGSDIYSA